MSWVPIGDSAQLMLGADDADSCSLNGRSGYLAVFGLTALTEVLSICISLCLRWER